VAGSAIQAFEEVCPERIDLIHKNYRKLCNLLVDVEEWGQVVIINMLTRYCRTQFANPNAVVSSRYLMNSEIFVLANHALIVLKLQREIDLTWCFYLMTFITYLTFYSSCMFRLCWFTQMLLTKESENRPAFVKVMIECRELCCSDSQSVYI